MKGNRVIQRLELIRELAEQLNKTSTHSAGKRRKPVERIIEAVDSILRPPIFPESEVAAIRKDLELLDQSGREVVLRERTLDIWTLRRLVHKARELQGPEREEGREPSKNGLYIPHEMTVKSRATSDGNISTTDLGGVILTQIASRIQGKFASSQWATINEADSLTTWEIEELLDAAESYLAIFENSAE
jgi:hypothetical protein